MNNISTSPAQTASRPVSTEQPAREQLTRVALAFVERRFNLYLRFGRPRGEIVRDRWRRFALFATGARFCRVDWEANEHGTTRWQLMVLQAGSTAERLHRIQGITPGAQLLLRAEGERRVRQVFQQIDAIEALGINPADVAPTYWRTLHNRLYAQLPLPAYTIERHVAHRTSEVLR